MKTVKKINKPRSFLAELKSQKFELVWGEPAELRLSGARKGRDWVVWSLNCIVAGTNGRVKSASGANLRTHVRRVQEAQTR